MGIMSPMSGPAVPHGVPHEQGAKWAADVINDAGGFKVGGETYMVKIVNADTKALGSAAVEAATMLIYEEDIHYTVGPLITSTLRAMRPLLMEAKVFSAPTSTHMGEAFYPYIMNVCPVDHHLAYHRSFYGMLVKLYPEMKTIGVMGPAG